MAVSMVVIASRPGDWTQERFTDWWRGPHADAAKLLPGLIAYRHGVVTTDYDSPDAPGWDGHAVLTFADQAALDAWCQRWIIEGLAACETLLARRAPSTFCFGETPTLADICLVPQVFSAQRFGADLSAMPRLLAVHAACEALPAFADAHPRKQPDWEA